MSIVSAAAQSCAQGCAAAVTARRGSSYPASLALLWRDTVNAQPLRYITFNGKYLVVKNV